MKWQLAFALLLILGASLSTNAAGHTKGHAVEQLTPSFKNGDYLWHPEISPAGPGRLLSGKTGAPSTPALAEGQFEWHPEDAPTGPVSIVLSTSDQKAYVNRDGIEIGRAAVSTTGVGQGLGSHVYSALDRFDSSGRREWISTASFGGRALAPDVKEVVNRVTIAPEFLEHARAAVSPGTTLVITDLPVSSRTRSGSGVDILTAD